MTNCVCARTWKAAAFVLAAFHACFAGAPGTAIAQPSSVQPNEQYWTPNGSVYATLRTPDYVYLGGLFDRVGPITGSGVQFTRGLEADLPEAICSRISGPVYAVEEDGEGGFFVGGSFRVASDDSGGYPNPRVHIDRQSIQLVHIQKNGIMAVPVMEHDPDNAVEPIQPKGDGIIYGIEFVPGDVSAGKPNRLYVAGDFQLKERDNPNPHKNVVCFTSVIESDDAMILARAGKTVSKWDWHLDTGFHAPDSIGIVRSIACDPNSNVVYLGGDNSNPASTPPRHLTVLDGITGSDETPTDLAQPDGTVHVLECKDYILYLGGEFEAIGYTVRRRAAAFDLSTGSPGDPMEWDPDCDGTVRAICSSAGGTYIGGDFTAVGGNASRPYLQFVDAYGAPVYADGTTPVAPLVNGPVHAIAGYQLTSEPERFVIGGDFRTVNGQELDRLAALAASSAGTHCPLVGWNPGAHALVRAIAQSGEKLYAGGEFSSMGGVKACNLVRLSVEDGAVEAVDGTPVWDPSPDNLVRSLVPGPAVNESPTLYVAGNFSHICGKNNSRSRLAQVTTGEQATTTQWNPSANGNIRCMTASGDTLYIGGGFSEVDDQPRSNFACFDWNSGALNSLELPAHSFEYPYVNDILPDDDGDINGNKYLFLAVKGSATSRNGGTRSWLLKLNRTDGKVEDWPNVPPQSPEYDTQALCFARLDNRIYSGGWFGLKIWDRTSGAELNFTNPLGTNPLEMRYSSELCGAPNSLAIAKNDAGEDVLYIAGKFNELSHPNEDPEKVEHFPRKTLACVNAISGVVNNWNPSTSSTVESGPTSVKATLIDGKYTIDVAGDFWGACLSSARGFAAFTPLPRRDTFKYGLSGHNVGHAEILFDQAKPDTDPDAGDSGVSWNPERKAIEYTNKATDYKYGEPHCAGGELNRSTPNATDRVCSMVPYGYSPNTLFRQTFSIYGIGEDADDRGNKRLPPVVLDAQSQFAEGMFLFLNTELMDFWQTTDTLVADAANVLKDHWEVNRPSTNPSMPTQYTVYYDPYDCSFQEQQPFSHHDSVLNGMVEVVSQSAATRGVIGMTEFKVEALKTPEDSGAVLTPLVTYTGQELVALFGNSEKQACRGGELENGRISTNPYPNEPVGIKLDASDPSDEYGIELYYTVPPVPTEEGETPPPWMLDGYVDLGHVKTQMNYTNPIIRVEWDFYSDTCINTNPQIWLFHSTCGIRDPRSCAAQCVDYTSNDFAGPGMPNIIRAQYTVGPHCGGRSSRIANQILPGKGDDVCPRDYYPPDYPEGSILTKPTATLTAYFTIPEYASAGQSSPPQFDPKAPLGSGAASPEVERLRNEMRQLRMTANIRARIFAAPQESGRYVLTGVRVYVFEGDALQAK